MEDNSQQDNPISPYQSHYFQAIYDHEGHEAATELDTPFNQIDFERLKSFCLYPLVGSPLQVALVINYTPGFRLIYRKEGVLNLGTDPNRPGRLVPQQGAYTYILGLVEDDGSEALKLTGGSNGPGGRTGLDSFNEFDDISIVCIPDEPKFPAVLADALVTHCENRKDRFAILQAEQSSINIPKLRPPKASKYAAFYYPWIKILDPLTGMLILVPSGGHVAGIYARVDQEKGVHKAPANEVVNGALGLEFNITKGEQDVLNPRGVNCIRAFPGRGILIWGARTAASDPAWKYVNVRRLFIFVEKSIEMGTQWVVFEPNDEKLWARVKQTINQFLTSVWRSGALMGTTQEEAFFVKCDRTTMTQNDIDNGRLVVLVGIAPVKPAEFVIFRIAQVAKGSEVSE